MKNRRRIVWTATLAPVVLLLALVAAWAIDTGAAGGQVVRNVEVAGTDVGGLESEALLAQITELDQTLADRAVTITTPKSTYETTAGALGLTIDAVATAQAALDEGRSSVVPVRPFGWLASFARPQSAPVTYAIDTKTTATALRDLEGDALLPPVEPTIVSLNGDPFTVVPGQPGAGIDATELATALTQAAATTDFDDPLAVRVDQSDLDPRLTDAVAQAAAERANALTDPTITVTAADKSIELVGRELRALIKVEETADDLVVSLDPEKVLPVLNEEFASLTVEAKNASFVVEGGVPVLRPAVTGRRCCDEVSAAAVNTAMLAGAPTVQLELNETQPRLSTEAAQALGIVTEVGSPTAFGPTTNHACCQNRVTNIHRMADIVRGAIILPGETFSINDYVGQRTEANGFVTDGVIYDGELQQDVGGGVSQFATTLFNAALYAGLDFGEYQSHSLYISRYPRGHEATVSFPNPDLQIKNTTPYGVLIWPTYSDTSITVHLYSTKSVDVTVGEATPAPSGKCTRWTTPRTRTYADGRVDTDSVSARYRPAEGESC